MNFLKCLLTVLFFALFFNVFSQVEEEQKTDTYEEDSTQNSINTIRKNNLESFMVLYKLSKPYRIDFPSGSKVTFRMKNDKKVEYSQLIERVLDSSFVAQGSNIAYKDVYSVKVARNRPFLELLSGVCVIGGAGYLILDLVNNSFTTIPETLVVSGSLLSLGGMLTLTVKPRTYKLNKNRFLKTLQKW